MNRTTLVPKVVLSAAVFLCPHANGESGSTRQPIAFIDVNVVPMDTERMIADQTVLIQDGRIRTIGPSASTPPSPRNF